MLDRIEVKKETKVFPLTRVVEKSVSPDKITEIYKEVREEVESSILRSFEIKTTSLHAVAMEFQLRHDTFKTLLLVRFFLNGKEHQRKVYIEPHLTEEKIYEQVADALAQEVTGILMQEFVITAFKRNR